MKIVIKSLTSIFLALGINSNAQQDTLSYLKQFEAKKALYIGQPFSKLLNDMTLLPPKSLYTQNSSNCNYGSQIWFTDAEKPFNSSYKMDVVWRNSYYYKDEKIAKGLYNINTVKEDYKNLVIEKMDVIVDDGFYVTTGDPFNSQLNPYNTIDLYLKEGNSEIINNSFLNFICWMRARFMKISAVKNIYDSSKKNVSQTIFTVTNPNIKKKAKIIITWDSPILESELQGSSNRIDNDKRSIYANKIVKAIKLL